MPLNPDFDPMAIIETNIDWEIDDDGWDIGTGEVFLFMIDTENTLFAYYKDKLYKERDCASMDHAEHIADAMETVVLRDRARGETWRGKEPM